jgi:GH18 family chitinase
VVPEPALVSDIIHVALAFMQSSIFNEAQPSAWPLFTTVETVRSQFASDTKIMVAIGGWGDTGFPRAAATESSRKLFAKNVKAMIDDTKADGNIFSISAIFIVVNISQGVDIDWEYPG